MQSESANVLFLKYETVFGTFDENTKKMLIFQTKRITAQHSLSQFFSFSCDTYVEVLQGNGLLLLSTAPETAPIEQYPLPARFRLDPNVYFGFVAETPELSVRLYIRSDCQMDAVTLAAPYQDQPALPRIRLENILGCHYRIHTPNYRSHTQAPPFFELTFLDAGVLHLQVDGADYRLEERELILCGPGQTRCYSTDRQTASYVTIQFTMENTAPGLPENWYSILTHRVFPYNKKICDLIQCLIRENEGSAPCADSLIHCLLTEIILRLLRQVYTAPSPQAVSTMRQHYRKELFDQILAYVESKLYEPLTVADICHQFSLSRSTLQHLFQSMVQQSPKQYISDMKLEKSCQLLQQNRYTVSEISLRLGYSSIHYFSNAFHQKYHITPSEYAKQSD